MSRTHFPLFLSHLDLAHTYFSKLVKKGDKVLDATCGNGYDTLKLCELALSENSGWVYSFDNQSQAIESTRGLLHKILHPEILSRVTLEQRCHSTFPINIEKESITLIVYNLGYLPGGDKTKTTMTDTTIQSLTHAKDLLCSGGVISVTCYPGHLEGKAEKEQLLDFASTFSPKEWSCSHHSWINRKQSPSLLILQKSK